MNHAEISKLISNKKSALYIRVSTHYQIDKDSLPVQREDLINYSKYALGIDKYEIFEDAGYSAKNTDRPAYQQMMARLRTGEFSHLVVWKIDRISRNLIDFATMYDELKSLGITFVSKNEQFDTSSAMGEAMLKIILVFAELERKMTSERVSAVLLSRATNGQWNGGRIPYGYNYNKEDRTFSINKDEAAVVNLIYNLYESCHSLLQVTKTLNEKHIYQRSGSLWSPTTVSIILKNPFYVGVYRYNYHDENKSKGNSNSSVLKPETDWVIIEDHHPAIIEAERQNKIVDYLERNRRSNKDAFKTYARKNIHIFAGLLECGVCGRQMQSTIDRERAHGYRPSIYMCSGRRRSNACANKYVSDITVAPFVLNYIANILKAQNNFGVSTSLDTFERKLLRGEMFSEVEHIEQNGLAEMYDMIKYGNASEAVYFSQRADKTESKENTASERDLLMSEKRKKERALARLKSLYLYNDEAISEKDFVVEQKSLIDSLKRIDERINEIDKNVSAKFTISDDEFMKKASLFIMSNHLQDNRFIDFKKLIRKIDNSVIKSFVQSVIEKIVVKNGRVTQITFKNGLIHKFLYKQS